MTFGPNNDAANKTNVYFFNETTKYEEFCKSLLLTKAGIK